MVRSCAEKLHFQGRGVRMKNIGNNDILFVRNRKRINENSWYASNWRDFKKKLFPEQSVVENDPRHIGEIPLAADRT